MKRLPTNKKYRYRRKRDPGISRSHEWYVHTIYTQLPGVESSHDF